MSGDYDPITPPHFAKLASETLPNSHLVVIPGEGHGVSPTSECTQTILSSFLDNPGGELKDQCLAELPQPKFVTEVRMTPALSRLMTSVGGGHVPPSLIAAGLMCLILATTLVIWPVAWIWQRLRKQHVKHPQLARRARFAAIVLALILLGFMALLVTLVPGVLSATPYLLAFGLPAGGESMFMLPWIAGLVSLLVIALAFNAWRSGWWGVGARIHYSLVAMSGLGLVFWIGSLGLI